MSLVKVLEEMKKYRPFIEENTDTGPQETLSARRGRKRQAIESMKTLKRQYTESLLRSAVFILVTGSESKEFETVAKEQFGCLSSDPNGFYVNLASRVHPSLYSEKEAVSNIFDVVGRHLEDAARELDVVGYPQLIFKQEYRRTIKNQEDFVNLLKIAINQQVGGEMVGLYAINTLTDAAIANNYAETVTPIVLATENAGLAKDLVAALERLTPKVFCVLAGKGPKNLKQVQGLLAIKDASPSNVEQTLKTIKSNLKK